MLPGLILLFYMLRKKIFHRHGKHIIRGTEIYRIEALSDAVFAFTVSLLIMSLEVPKTFEELKQIIIQFLPFLVTVSLVFFFWHLQNEYFRNYGLNDGRVLFLNLSLLILILFYAYPLKFLFSVLLGWVFDINYFEEVTRSGKIVLAQQEFPQLILFFSIGYAVIWFIFYLLYKHVYQKRVQPEFNIYELIYLKSQMQDALVQVGIGVVSIFFSLANYPALSGLSFLLIPFWLLLNNYLVKRKLKRRYPNR